MKYVLIGFGLVFAYRLAVNVSSLFWLNHYYKEYTLYLSDPKRNFEENTSAIKKLFDAAGLTDRMIPVAQPVGYGQIMTGHTMVFSNMANRREDVVGNMLSCFATARGTFKNRIIENFSPIFWVNCVLFLPRTVLKYLGVSGDSIFSKLLQLTYWAVTPFLILLRDEIYQAILLLFN